FDALQPGVEVRFEEEAGERGPQATTVQVIGKTPPRGLKVAQQSAEPASYIDKLSPRPEHVK
ncbi:MAG: cold-shock protein, partial [Gammaproteobacteria bacterium]